MSTAARMPTVPRTEHFFSRVSLGSVDTTAWPIRPNQLDLTGLDHPTVCRQTLHIVVLFSSSSSFPLFSVELS